MYDSPTLHRHYMCVWFFFVGDIDRSMYAFEFWWYDMMNFTEWQYKTETLERAPLNLQGETPKKKERQKHNCPSPNSCGVGTAWIVQRLHSDILFQHRLFVSLLCRQLQWLGQEREMHDICIMYSNGKAYLTLHSTVYRHVPLHCSVNTKRSFEAVVLWNCSGHATWCYWH